MNSESRSFLKQQIQTYLQKYPDCTGKDVKKWILSGDQEFNLMDVQRDTLNKFIQYNLGKFREEGQCVKHKGGNGRKQTPRTVVARINFDVEQEEKVLENCGRQGWEDPLHHSQEHYGEEQGQGLP